KICSARSTASSWSRTSRNELPRASRGTFQLSTTGGARMTAFRYMLCAVLLAMGANAGAQPSAYPAKPVRVIVSTVPGPLDTFARMVLEKISTSMKQPFVVENKPGAGGNIAAEVTAKSAADGYTLLFAIDTTFTVNPTIYKT